MGMNFPLFIFNIRPDYYLNLINVDLKWNKKTKKDETIIFIKKFDLWIFRQSNDIQFYFDIFSTIM